MQTQTDTAAGRPPGERTHQGRAAAPADVASFLERFCRFGATPSAETYLPLFHPDVTLFDDGMERPIGIAEIPDSITATLALAQGFVMVPERWRVAGDAVFVEARNEAAIFGTPLRWQSVYRVVLAGEHVIDGRRYYDRAPLLAALDPSLPRLASLEPDAAELAVPEPPPALAPGAAAEDLVRVCSLAWQDGGWRDLAALFRDDATWLAPAVTRPLGRDAVAAHRRRLAALLGGARPQVRRFAGDDGLVLIEWQADVPTPSGATYALGMIDRFDLVAGRVLAARTYFDAASLARALSPIS